MAAVHSQHPSYRGTDYALIRDCYEGQSRIKFKREKYLPKTGGQKQLEKMDGCNGAIYNNYVHYARFPDLLKPIVHGMAALASRVEYKVEGLPPAMNYLYDDAGSGLKLAEYQMHLITEGLLTGRYALFPDVSVGDLDGKPRFAFYEAESILNWRESEGNLILAVLVEVIANPGNTDEFSHDMVKRYRVLRIQDKQFSVEVYDHNGVSTSRNDGLTYKGAGIPLVIGSATGKSVAPEVPPLMGVCDAALSYYGLSALHRQGLWLTCNPTLAAFGFEEGDIQMVGAGAIVETSKSKTEADMKYVEVEGSGLARVETAMDGELSAAEQHSHRLTERGGVEAAGSLRQRTSSKTATLKSIDRCAANALEKGLKLIADMMSLNGSEIKVTSSFDYTDDDIENTVLDSLRNSVLDGQLPRKAVFDYVRQRGVLERFTDAEITDMIDADQMATDFGGVNIPAAQPLDDSAGE